MWYVLDTAYASHTHCPIQSPHVIQWMGLSYSKTLLVAGAIFVRHLDALQLCKMCGRIIRAAAAEHALPQREILWIDGLSMVLLGSAFHELVPVQIQLHEIQPGGVCVSA